MIDARLLENLLAYSVQVTMVVAAGAVIVALSRVQAPRVRHAWWRGLLVAALVMPLFYSAAPAPAAPPFASGLPGPRVAVLNVSLATGRVSSNEPIDWMPIVFGVLAAGVAFRLLWTAMGLWRLRRLRHAGTDVTADFAELQDTVGASADIRRTRAAEQPVTFGIRRPVVVLPDSLFDQPANIQQAVVCHELVHVRRRDWTWLLVEEGLRAVFWFHPVVWWALSRIQLTREEVVDAEVVETTRERRAYVEALMTFADEAPLNPAAAFSRRRHLFRRILLISKEASMSPARIVLSCLVMAAVAGTGSWYAAWAFPLQVSAPVTAPRPGVVAGGQLSDEIGPLERQAKPVTAENPVPRRTYAVSPQYPAAAGEARGVLTLRATLDAQGRVAELRSLRGPSTASVYHVYNLFAAAAIDAVRQWQFEPPYDAPISFDVSVAFTPESGNTSSNITPQPIDEFAVRVDQAKGEYMRLLRENERALANQTSGPSEQELTEARARLLAVEREIEERLRARRREDGERALADASRQTSPEALIAAREQLVKAERQLVARRSELEAAVAREQEERLRAVEQRATQWIEAGRVYTARPGSAAAGPVRVGGAVLQPTKTRHVAPVYPEEARAAGVQGVVIAELTIDESGRVQDARVLRSIPLLDQAALDAVRQWEYTPTLLNGSPVPVIMTVTVQFTLSE